MGSNLGYRVHGYQDTHAIYTEWPLGAVTTSVMDTQKVEDTRYLLPLPILHNMTMSAYS